MLGQGQPGSNLQGNFKFSQPLDLARKATFIDTVSQCAAPRLWRGMMQMLTGIVMSITARSTITREQLLLLDSIVSAGRRGLGGERRLCRLATPWLPHAVYYWTYNEQGNSPRESLFLIIRRIFVHRAVEG